MQVHWREERDVEQHDTQDDQGEAEGAIEFIGQMNRKDVVLLGIQHTGVLAEQFTRDSSGIGNDEKCVSENTND